MSKSGSSEAAAACEGGEASQRTEEGARRRPPRWRPADEAAGENSAERSGVVMVAIAGVGLVALGGRRRRGRTANGLPRLGRDPLSLIPAAF